MKKIFILSLLILAYGCSSPKEEEKTDETLQLTSIEKPEYHIDNNDTSAIVMEWKLGEDEIIAYQFAMEEIDLDEIEINIEDALGDGFNEFDLDDIQAKQDFDDLMDELKKSFENIELSCLLQWKENSNIGIKMITNEYDNEIEIEDSDISIPTGLSGVVLRGEINKYGGIESFYSVNRQRNLIALTFELPNKPVKIGDIWSIDVNYIEMDQSFICHNSQRINEVQLVDIYEKDNDSIAVMKYYILEEVVGEMVSFSDEEKEDKEETRMFIKYTAIAEFSLNQGRWISYNGIMNIEQSGMMDYDMQQSFVLIPYKEIPEMFYDIE